MQALLLILKPLLVKLASKELLKLLLTALVDVAVKSSKTDVDDRIWVEVKPILEKL